MANDRAKARHGSVSLDEALVSAGMERRVAELIQQIPHRALQVEPRRPFREPGAPIHEAIFVTVGILAKFMADGSGRRQIVALRFPGEGILPRDKAAPYGIQAIVRSDVIVAKARDFEAAVEGHPQLQKFFRSVLQRNEAIGYEWLVNCGRRDSTARVAHLLCETVVRMHGDEQRLLNPFTQQQMADITGQTSVNVNRVLADLERGGLIKREGREIAFLDWSELQRVASFQPAYLQ